MTRETENRNRVGVHNASEARPALRVYRLSQELKQELASYCAALKKDIGTQFNLHRFLMTSAQYENWVRIEGLRTARGIPGSHVIVPGDLGRTFADMFTAIVGMTGKSDDEALQGVDTLVRWVEAQSEDELQKVVNAAEANGGKTGSLDGLCMSEPGSKADKVMSNTFQWPDKSGALFIYDPSKLRHMTKTEAELHTSFAGGYGYKPRDEETYRSALLGVIVI